MLRPRHDAARSADSKIFALQRLKHVGLPAWHRRWLQLASGPERRTRDE